MLSNIAATTLSGVFSSASASEVTITRCLRHVHPDRFHVLGRHVAAPLHEGVRVAWTLSRM
jgi:hypothetical protein